MSLFFVYKLIYQINGKKTQNIIVLLCRLIFYKYACTFLTVVKNVSKIVIFLRKKIEQKKIMYLLLFKTMNITSIDMPMTRTTIIGPITRDTGTSSVVGPTFIAVNVIYNIYIFLNLPYVHLVNKLL